MTDSDPQLIRHATIDDLDALAAMESECFPAAEAADRSSLRARIETYPECFWLLIDGEIVMAFINGFATDRRDLTDDMYEDANDFRRGYCAEVSASRLRQYTHEESH